MTKGFPTRPPHCHRQPGAAFPQARSAPGVRLLAVLLGCVCLAGPACSRDEADTRQQSASVAPTDVFSLRAPRPPSPASRRILVVGDSLSISLGEQLERALAGAPGIDYSRDGARSTGLTRPELLDWPAHLRERVAKDRPDVVVIMIGANDVMPVTGPDGSRVYFDSPAWPAAYAAKARELVTVCRQTNPDVVVYWVGVPSMGEASLSTGVLQVNAALAAMCEAQDGCRFIDTQAAFSDPEGRFTRHAKDAATGETAALRTADGVHMTDAGAKLLAGLVLKTLADKEALPTTAGMDELRAFARDIRPVPEEAPQRPERTPPPPRKVKATNKVYAAKNGDTLLTIARRLGVNADDLAAVNPDVDPRHIAIGQNLRIPAKPKR